MEWGRLVVTNGGRHIWLTPARATWLITGILAALAAVLTGPTDNGPLLAVHLAWAPLAVAALFAGAEAGYMSVEFRSQTYSFTVAGIPLVLGLLACSTWQVVAARLLGAAAVLLIQRLPPVKTAYNLAAFAFETALAGWGLHAISGRQPHLSLLLALAVYGVLAAVDLVMSILVLVVIRLHGGPLGPRTVIEALLPAAGFNAISLAYALLAVELLADGPLGWALLGATSAVSAVGYRAYTRLGTRHQSLTQVSEFVEEDLAVRDVEDLAGRRVARVRALLRAGSAHAVLGDSSSDALFILSVDAADQLSTVPVSRTDLDWVCTRVREQDQAMLVRRGTKDPGLRRWLTDRGVRDAIVVPLSYGDGMRGTLTVTDRLSDHSSFTTDDVTLLRTLAGHLGVALRSTRLLQRLRHDATHDVLTGLANRALLQEHLGAALGSAGTGTTGAASDDGTAGGSEIAVLVLDLDGFKEVNDALGHEVGDRLLEVVGQRLSATSPPGSTVARLGGDEFAILLPTPPRGASTRAEATALALARAVAVPVTLEEATLSVEASIGVATTRDGDSVGDLLRHADTAMYAAKVGGVAVQRYSPELDRGRGERLALVADLRLALTRDELFVLYQPKVDLRTRQVVGAEALVRWRHPRLGTLSPDTFIPIAESTGLIEPLTRLVLRSALGACRTWREAGLTHATVAVNLSARTVAEPTLPQTITEELAFAGLPAQALVVEITESSVMTDAEGTVPILDQLVAGGLTISLDDFGTGYSSLAYLQRLPVQELKIDRSFVAGFAQSAGDDPRAGGALIHSILSLGTAFGLRVVAEGIEDADTLERLAALGCDSAQGYHFGRPDEADVLLTTARALQHAAAQRDLPRPRLHVLPSHQVHDLTAVPPGVG